MAQLSGYDTEDRYYATFYQQGGRPVYSIDLSLAQVAATLPKPDPNRPTLGNRRVKEAHARGFARYVREKTGWVAPAILLRCPDGIFTFQTKEEIGGSKFGILAIPRLARTDLRILDGQHRILGLHYAIEELSAELEEARNSVASARRNGDAGLERHFADEVARLERQRHRLDHDRISIQIHIEDAPEAFKQMFVDIADNALGITASLRSRFDARKVVNRALDEVLKHHLLVERVDFEQDRIGASSPYLMGAKHVADIIRTIRVGIGGRIGRRLESELVEGALVQKTNDFLDTLVDGFPDLDALIEKKIAPAELRRSSLLGSTTILRILSGAYYQLAQDLTDDEITEFFGKLSHVMKAPIESDGPWTGTGAFAPGAMAPYARGRDLLNLVNTIVNWAKTPPDWLETAALHDELEGVVNHPL